MKTADTFTQKARDDFKKFFEQANIISHFTDEEIDNMSLTEIHDYLEKSIDEDIKKFAEKG